MPICTDPHATSIITELLSFGIWRKQIFPEKTGLLSTTAAMLEIHINFLLPSTQNHFTCTFKSCIFDIEELNKDTFEHSGSWRVCVQYIKNKINRDQRGLCCYRRRLWAHIVSEYIKAVNTCSNTKPLWSSKWIYLQILTFLSRVSR